MIRSYLRVSTAEQAEDNRSSLDQQKQRTLGAALMRGANEQDVTFYTDAGVSGGTPLAQRPEGARLLADLREGDTVVAAKLDRLFRSCVDALTVTDELKKRKVAVILCDCSSDPINEDGAGKFFFSIMAAAAEFEKNRIAERMRDGRAGKKQRGGHIGGEAPFGFKVIGSGRDAKLVENPPELAVVKVAAELSTTRSLHKVCTEMNRRGLKNRAGGAFQPVQIQRMIARAHH